MKVVILAAKYGMGHMSAAKSIEQDIKKFNNSAEVKIIDFYEYTMPVLSKYLYKAFSWLIKYAQPLYSSYYTDSDKKTGNNDLLTRKFAAFAKKLEVEEKPDVIISTFPLISKGIGYYKEISGSKVHLITTITDVSSHHEWINEGTDKYLVACEDIKNELIDKGIDSDRIVVYGIPVSNLFRDNYSRGTERKSLFSSPKVVNIMDYSKKNKELLIMGGGLGLLPKEESFYEKLNTLDNLHTTIVTGNNKEMYDHLKDKYERITVLGFSNNVHELMDRADCVVTKPGGITVFEAIYSLTPIISFESSLPNEVKNIDFIEDNNFGMTLHGSAEKNIDRIIKFMNKDEEIKNMKNSMSNFVKSLSSNYFSTYMYDLELLNESKEIHNNSRKIESV